MVYKGLMKNMSYYVSRRRFFKAAGVVLASTALPKWFLDELDCSAQTNKPLSPNDRPGIALIGCGGQGRGDCNWAKNYGDVVAVCDVDEKHLEEAANQFARNGKKPTTYKDFRKLLEDKNVNVIINGTPDHWHTLVNLAAAKAGKDIYTEKPLTLTIDEGKRLIKAVRENKIILQVGSQQRSDPRFRLACELVRNGRIGKIKHVTVGLPTGPREGPFKPIPVPPELNWDYYLGQAPPTEYNGHNCHWNFRWWYIFSGGQMTDWGAHHNDIAQWGLGTELSGPVEFDGKSLVDMIPGGYDAAAEFVVNCKYENGVTMTITDGKRAPNGVKFEGTEGWIFVTRGEIKASKPELLEEPLPSNAIRLYKSDNHMGNFFECVKSRKDPICPVEIGHRSISVAHLGVISVRLNRPIKWDPVKEEIIGDKEANSMLVREMRKPYDYSFIA
jgi:predicted dehydrogenase